MSDEGEAFPNAKSLFWQTLYALNPGNQLVELLKTHPTYEAVCDLVIFYVKAVKQDPHRGQCLASAFCEVVQSPYAPTIADATLFSLIND
ncbi:hypothetical protein CPB83DRAFT_432765 [Crepidotus variabilis]|uniref:Uncharacterized protein n=1 Tax=Crepidotus variabilis TaxID=179855 RepID=A0A9P6JN83_9AGAR|nr:hypothetical protein CPB83DRAFT_432765 [Crepidotus variabilis]